MGDVVERFLRGPLERLPRREADRLALLRHVRGQVLAPGESVDEPELNRRLRAFTQDTAMLRRALVDYGLVSRSARGTAYRAEEDDAGSPSEEPAGPDAASRGARTGVVVREARPGDYPEIARITVAAYLASGHFDPESPYLRYIADVADRHRHTDIWVAEQDGNIVGSVTLVRHGSRYADIALEHELEFRMLAVDPAVQRSGAGRALVRAIVDRARALDGVHAVSLTTGEVWGVPRRLYESEGFEHVPERDWLVPGTDIRLVVYVLPLGAGSRGR